MTRVLAVLVAVCVLSGCKPGPFQDGPRAGTPCTRPGDQVSAGPGMTLVCRSTDTASGRKLLWQLIRVNSG